MTLVMNLWLKLEFFFSSKEKEVCLIFENGLPLNQDAAHLIASLSGHCCCVEFV